MDSASVIAKTSNNAILKIEVKNVKSRILYDSNIYNDYFIYALQIIDNKLSFFAQNYENNADYNTVFSDGTRKWDGKIHLFNPYPHTKYYLEPFEFYTGKIYEVLLLLYQLGYKVELDDQRPKHTIGERKYNWNEQYPPYDYQEAAALEALKNGRGIIKAATGSGKTNLGALIVQKIGVAPVIFLVTTIELLKQAKDRFESLLQEPIGSVGGGLCDIKDITICTVQTCFMAFGKEDEYKKQIRSLGIDEIEEEEHLSQDKYEDVRKLIRSAKMLVFDEIHHSPSDTCASIMTMCENATYRFGLGATVKRDDGLEMLTEGLFGQYLCNISMSDVIKMGKAIAPDIYLIPVNSELGLCENYQSEYKAYITENEIRNNMIAQMASECVASEVPTLVLVKFISHGEHLEDLIKEKVRELGLDESKIVFIHGKLSKTKREKIVEGMKNKSIICALASSLADEGLDIPCLQVLILAVGGKSSVKTIQRVGRVVRKDPNNSEKIPVVYDFVEPRQAKFLHKHSIIRKKMYETEPLFRIHDLRYKNNAKKTWGFFD